MKQLIYSLLATTVLMSGLEAAILAGDTLVINFTYDNPVGGNWNDITEPDGGTDGWGVGGAEVVGLSADLVRFSDGAATGIGLNYEGLVGTGTKTSQSAMYNNWGKSGDNAASFSVSGAISASAQTDAISHYDAESQYIFTGLDDSLTYNLEFQVFSADRPRNAKNWQINPDQSGATQSIDPNTSPSVYSFLGISTDGSGNITLRHFTDGTGTNETGINAMELTAIPEPSSLMLAGIAAASGLIWMKGRRR